jgi:probable HAF family extracellular repeat protein
MGSLKPGRSSSKATRYVSCFALALTLCVDRAAFAQGPPYTFTKVQVPGATKNDASGINNSGQVVGTYFSSDGTVHGYKFDGSAYATVDFPGAPYTFVFGIGNGGKMVGTYAFTTAGPWFGLLADQGTFTSYAYQGQQTDGRAINANGDIVGVWDIGAVPDHGYSKSGNTFTSIDYPGAQQTYALGLNDAGTVSGSYISADGMVHGFAQAGGQFSPIDMPGAVQTFVGGINNLHTVVGWSQTGTATHGFVLTGGNRFRAFDVDFAGAVATKPLAVNDTGRIVGTYLSPDCPNECGFQAVPRTDVLPSCDQSLTLQYTAGTLKMDFGLRTSVPFTWSVSLFALNVHIPLWSAAILAVSPAVSFEVPIASFPAVGSVYGISMLKDATGAPICLDIANVNTGGA